MEIGPGPGRFSPALGRVGGAVVLLDLSQRMLAEARRHLRRIPELAARLHPVLGDGLHPPFRELRFNSVVVLGNVIGFGSSDAEAIVRSAAAQVALAGHLLIEIAPGPGERSRYLARLPPGAVSRLLRSPVTWSTNRIAREGFQLAASSRGRNSAFRPVDAPTAVRWLVEAGLEIEETVAVAPAIGQEPDRVASVRGDPIAWRHLLEVEERLGARPERWTNAAAILVAARRAPTPTSAADRTSAKN
ncbi:MAG: class I SAM-dependent methyltransferase [Thermoplasmata archaeon]|nr:class I SAM-dependent methyltransferase [Thermoplasmata archaeon]